MTRAADSKSPGIATGFEGRAQASAEARTLPETMGGAMGHAAGREGVSGHMIPWHWVPRYALVSLLWYPLKLLICSSRLTGTAAPVGQSNTTGVLRASQDTLLSGHHSRVFLSRRAPFSSSKIHCAGTVKHRGAAPRTTQCTCLCAWSGLSTLIPMYAAGATIWTIRQNYRAGNARFGK